MGLGKGTSLGATMIVVGTLAGAASAATFTGNGGTGFGGPIGNSSLTVTDAGSTINFSLTTGTPFSGNALVLYLDSKAGGSGSTSTYTDNADGGRTAVSGLSGSGRTLATFAPGFGADYAVTVEPGVFSGVFDLSTPSNFGFVASAGLGGSGSGPYTFSVNKSDIGLSGGGTLSIEGTLISTSGYRSNETIGTSVTTPGSPGDAPNAGFTGTTTFATANSLAVAAVPEPATLGAIVGAGLVALRRRRR